MNFKITGFSAFLLSALCFSFSVCCMWGNEILTLILPLTLTWNLTVTTLEYVRRFKLLDILLGLMGIKIN